MTSVIKTPQSIVFTKVGDYEDERLIDILYREWFFSNNDKSRAIWWGYNKHSLKPELVRSFVQRPEVKKVTVLMKQTKNTMMKGDEVVLETFPHSYQRKKRLGIRESSEGMAKEYRTTNNGEWEQIPYKIFTNCRYGLIFKKLQDANYYIDTSLYDVYTSLDSGQFDFIGTMDDYHSWLFFNEETWKWEREPAEHGTRIESICAILNMDHKPKYRFLHIDYQAQLQLPYCVHFPKVQEE